MTKNETISEIMIRLAKEYDFSGKIQKDEEDGSVYEGTLSAVVLEWNVWDCEDAEWFARMTNGGSVTHIFWDGKNNEDSYIDIATVAATAEEALAKLEEMCKTYTKKGYIIIDPTEFEWWPR